MDKLADLVREVFDAPQAEVARSTTANDIEGWDSLSHVNLIVAVEVSFKIRFTNAEALKFRNVGELADAIEDKLQAP